MAQQSSSQRVTVRLPQDLFHRLENAAIAHDRTFTSELRAGVRSYLQTRQNLEYQSEQLKRDARMEAKPPLKQFLLRIPEDEFQQVARYAYRHNRSINREIIYALRYYTYTLQQKAKDEKV